jgi:chorismate synthase
MPGNSFGQIFRLTTFGESHGIAIGGVIDGCPPNLYIDEKFLQLEMDRRKPGQSEITTQRKETDKVEFLSGLFENKTTGAPIAFIIQNSDSRSVDYEQLKEVYRPSHADFTYDKKYNIRDFRGGGRSSARETAARVVAGAIAKMLLHQYSVSIQAYVSQIGNIKLTKSYSEVDLKQVEENKVRCPDAEIANKMIIAIEQAKTKGDSLGGIIACVIKGTPIGLGEPVFDKLHADLGKAMLSINAVKGFDIGEGFNAANLYGSENNDEFILQEGKIRTKTNHSGGIQGGISNGEDIYFNVAFKPTSTIQKPQQTIDKKGKETDMEGKGRHDPCVLPRAVVIVEAMAACVITDHLLRNKMYSTS